MHADRYKLINRKLFHLVALSLKKDFYMLPTFCRSMKFLRDFLEIGCNINYSSKNQIFKKLNHFSR